MPSTVGDSQIYRFGDSYVDSNINDQTRYNRMYNKVGAVYENSLLGKFQFFAEDFRYNYLSKAYPNVFDKGNMKNAGLVFKTKTNFRVEVII